MEILMTALSNYVENLLVRWLLTNEAVVPRPTSWYVALFVTPTTDAGGGTELSGGNYARQSVVFTLTAPGANTVSNSTDITFVSNNDWPMITNVAIMDAPTNGNMLYHGALLNPRDPTTNDTIRFASGQLIAGLD